MQNFLIPYFLLVLLLSYLFVWIFRKYLFFINIRRLFPIVYLAVFVHEIFHYLMALICLKWPTYKGIKVERSKERLHIKGGVSVKVFSYKDLIYNIMRGNFVVEGLLLIHQLIASFLIALAPIIFPYLILYYFFFILGIDFVDFDILNSLQKIPLWHFLILFPLSFFGALISSPSKEDLKIALPLLIFLIFIPTPSSLINFLIFTSFLLFVGILILILLWFLTYLHRSLKAHRSQ